MRNFLTILSLLCLLTIGSAEAANTNYYSFVNGATSAGSLNGSELLAITKGGSQTFNTTTQAIANLAPGGSGTPGGIQYQTQFNAGSGVFGGYNEYNVAAYGAKCDAKIQIQGVVTTASSGTVSSPNYSFTAADVGATIVIWNPGFANNPVNGTPTNFISTIASVAGGNITGFAGGATPSFTSASYKYAGAFWYHTNDTTAIQAAINAANAAGGGRVIFPALCATGQLTIYNNITLDGGNPGQGGVALVNGANATVIKSYNYDSLVGTNTYLGTYNTFFNNFLIFGNRAANTATNVGEPTATGDGVQIYGTAIGWNNLYIIATAGDGWYSEWGNGAGSPSYSMIGLEADSGFNYQGWYDGGACMIWNGPHDSRFDYVVCSGDYGLNSAGGGIINGTTQDGSPLTIANYHGYQNTNVDLVVDQPYFTCISCDLEGGAQVGSYSEAFISSGIGDTGATGLVFSCGTSGSFYNTFQNTSVSNITNLTGCDSGTDFWYASGYSGTNTGYTSNPALVFGGGGWTYGINLNNTGGIYIQNYPSWAVILKTTTNSDFTIDNGGGHIFWSTSGQALSLGPSAVTPQAGTHLDLHTMTDSMILPTGNTGARPGTGIGGMLRYNTSLPGIEAYFGSAWNQLASTSGFIAGGTTFSIASGCGTPSSLLGGATVGSFHAGQASCAPVITLPAAPNGWVCHAHDLTNPADAFTQTASSTTSCTMSATVTTSDVIQFDATGY